MCHYRGIERNQEAARIANYFQQVMYRPSYSFNQIQSCSEKSGAIRTVTLNASTRSLSLNSFFLRINLF